MPKVNINYENTVIYKIVCKDITNTSVYIGHTTNFIKRKTQHKDCCRYEFKNKKNNTKIYETIKNNGGWDNWDMVEIEKFPCLDGNEARARERYWYELHESKLNTQAPNRTRQEYKLENKEKVKQANHEYFIKHKTEIYIKRKEKREPHKDKINEKSKEYREKHKDEINEKKRQKIVCICGASCSKNGKSKHEKTKKHLDFIESNF
jgi:GIY-YIG catalytic domain